MQMQTVNFMAIVIIFKNIERRHTVIIFMLNANVKIENDNFFFLFIHLISKRKYFI